MAKIVSISIPNDSIGEIESIGNALGLKGKSELVRLALHTLDNETKDLMMLKGKINAILVVTHQHDAAVEKILHQYDQLITMHTHQHINAKCVEIFSLKGNAQKIREFYAALIKNKHVRSAKVIVI